jgi:hypothetical protein
MNYDLKKIWHDDENWARTRDEGVIETVNDVVLLGENYEIKERSRLDVSDLTGGNQRCLVEDIRLAQYDDKIIALGVIGLDHQVTEESGKLLSTVKTARTFIAQIQGNRLAHSRIIDSPSGVAWDKNWVMASRPKTSAFRICTNINAPGTIVLEDLHDAVGVAETGTESLKWKGGWSGSTNLVPFAGDHIAIIHRSRQDPLVYEHLMVICDDKFRIKRISAPFTFEGQPIEFCCGMERAGDDKIVVAYCTWDQSILAEYPVDVLDAFCHAEISSNSDLIESTGMRPL